MIDGEVGGMQKRPLGATRVRQGLAVQGSIVDALAAQRRAALAQVNADLVGPAGFQAACDQGKIAKFLDNLHVRNGFLTRLGGSSATAAIAAGGRDDWSVCFQ